VGRQRVVCLCNAASIPHYSQRSRIYKSSFIIPGVARDEKIAFPVTMTIEAQRDKILLTSLLVNNFIPPRENRIS
jgi:hypothetical protein